jgi:hypothetical protein
MQAAGVAAREALPATLPILEERHQRLCIEAVAKYKAGKLDPTGALLFVAGIAANMDLIDELEFRARRGDAAGKTLKKEMHNG